MLTGTVTMDGGSTSADFSFGDQDKAIFGAGSDLQIWHDTNHSYIQDTSSGDLRLTSNGSGVMITKTTTENMARFLTDGAVELYYDGGTYTTPKLATTATGVDVTGTVTTDGLTSSAAIVSQTGGSNSAPAIAITTGALGVNGITAPAANTIAFVTGAGERLRIDSSGNVGIGKSSSITDRLHIEKSGANCLLSVARTSDGAAGRLVMQHTNAVGALQTTGSVPLTFGTNDTERMRIDSSGVVGIGVVPSGTAKLQVNGQIYASADGSASAPAFAVNDGDTGMFRPANNNLAFTTGGTERMRIDTSGKVNIGTSAVDGFLQVKHNNNADVLLMLHDTSGAGGTAIRFKVNGSTVGSIANSASGTSFNTTSDHRLKENVVDMTGATTRLKQLNPVRFNFIADADTTVDGFLAHEVQTVVPEAITGTHNEVDDDGNPVYQGIDQSKLVPLLVATIQELEARLTALENAE